jgi:tRNA A37 methylthiotransferase MiaB
MPRSPRSISVENKKIKILLYHCNDGGYGWIYTTALQLKTYIDLLYPATAEKLEWLTPLQAECSDEELLQHIKQNKVDILCTSHYLWNHEQLTNQLCRIKDRLHRQTVIAGGPSIDVNVNEKFFQQHPYIDYAVYGAGEQAFADIVNHLVLGSPMIAFNTSNCAWQNSNTGKTVVADYKFVKMLETSPFLHNETMFVDMIKSSQHTTPWISYTLTRGCPYACTFCDWNSGLGNKVSRRKNTYQQEIDLFQKLGITNIYLADANVGQYNEDVEMIEYFAKKNLNENTNFHVGGNFSKLKKENNLKIFHTMAHGNLINKIFNFSVQEINQEVMKNINRPDVGWDVHLAMIEELTTSHPHFIAKVQLIYGLPGQTLDGWQQTLQTVTEKNVMPVIFLNEPLPASPAMTDPEYQRRFQFEYAYSQRISSNKKYFSYIPKKSSSFDQPDLVEMTIVSGAYWAISLINLALIENCLTTLNVADVMLNFTESIYYQNLYQNLYDNWTTENNFYFTNGISQENIVNSTFKNYMITITDQAQSKIQKLVATKGYAGIRLG